MVKAGPSLAAEVRVPVTLPPPWSPLSDNARKVRIRSGMSMGDVADALGVARSTISMYELRKIRISRERLEKLAELYGVMPDDLMEVEE